jgi:hypothetical protein
MGGRSAYGDFERRQGDRRLPVPNASRPC